jgi:hypothetical protein
VTPLEQLVRFSAPHVIGDPHLEIIGCEHCGEQIPLPLGAPQWVSAVATAFVEQHQTCRPGDGNRGRCRFAVPPEKGVAP